MESDTKLKQMLFFDVNNGIARRAWARNKEALNAIETELERTSTLKITKPELVEDNIIDNLF
jgi:urocanate hydratase